MMLLYNVYVCLLKFLRIFVNVLGAGGVFLFFFLIICAMVLYFNVLCYVGFVGFYFKCATCLIIIY